MQDDTWRVSWEPVARFRMAFNCRSLIECGNLEGEFLIGLIIFRLL